MSSCRADSFYLAPGVLRYFRKNSVFARHPDDGRIVMFASRKEIHAFIRNNPQWDGLLHVGPPGDSGQVSKILKERPDRIEVYQTSERVIEGRRPEDAAAYVAHQWAMYGLAAAGGARQVVETMFPGATRPMVRAAVRLAETGSMYQLQVASAAWRSGALADPNRMTTVLQRLPAFAMRAGADTALPQVMRHLAGLDEQGVNVDLEGVIVSAADPLTVLDPGTVTALLPTGLATTDLLHRALDEGRTDLFPTIASSPALDAEVERRLLRLLAKDLGRGMRSGDIAKIAVSLANNPATSPDLLATMIADGVPSQIASAYRRAVRAERGNDLLDLVGERTANYAIFNPAAPLETFYAVEKDAAGQDVLVRRRPTLDSRLAVSGSRGAGAARYGTEAAGATAPSQPVSTLDLHALALNSRATPEHLTAVHAMLESGVKLRTGSGSDHREVQRALREEALRNPRMTLELAAKILDTNLSDTQDLSELPLTLGAARALLTSPAFADRFAGATFTAAATRLHLSSASPAPAEEQAQGAADLTGRAFLDPEQILDRRLIAAAVASGQVPQDTVEMAHAAAVRRHEELCGGGTPAELLESVALLAAFSASPAISPAAAIAAVESVASAPRTGTENTDSAAERRRREAQQQQEEEGDRELHVRVELLREQLGEGRSVCDVILNGDIVIDAALLGHISTHVLGPGRQADDLTPEARELLVQVAGRPDLDEEQLARVLSLSRDDRSVIAAAQVAGHRVSRELQDATRRERAAHAADVQRLHRDRAQRLQLQWGDPVDTVRASDLIAAAVVMGARGLQDADVNEVSSVEQLRMSDHVKILSPSQREDLRKLEGHRSDYQVDAADTRGWVRKNAQHMGNCTGDYADRVEKGSSLLFHVTAPDGTEYNVHLKKPKQSEAGGTGPSWQVGEINTRHNAAGQRGEKLAPELRAEISALFAPLCGPVARSAPNETARPRSTAWSRLWGGTRG